MKPKYDLNRPHDAIPSGSDDVNTSHPEQAESAPSTSGPESRKADPFAVIPSIAFGPKDPPTLVSSTKPHPKRKIKDSDPAWVKREKETRLDPTKGVGGPSYIDDIDKSEISTLSELVSCMIAIVKAIAGFTDDKIVPPDRVNELKDGDKYPDYDNDHRERPTSSSMSHDTMRVGTDNAARSGGANPTPRWP